VTDKNQEKAMIAVLKYNFEVGVFKIPISCPNSYNGLSFGKIYKSNKSHSYVFRSLGGTETRIDTGARQTYRSLLL